MSQPNLRRRSRQRLRVLLVEDSRERISWFRRRLRGHGLAVASDYRTAVALLKGSGFDLVLLDHDLNDRAHNGQDIAAWLATRLTRRQRPTKVVVHSTNPAGGYGVYLTLMHAGFDVEVMPFPEIRLPRLA